MATSSLRLFRSSNQKLLTYSRFLKWTTTNSASSVKRRQFTSSSKGCKDEEELMSSSSLEKSLPEILLRISEDKKLVRNFTDVNDSVAASQHYASGASSSASSLAARNPAEIFNKIEDVKKFLEELNRRRDPVPVSSQDAEEIDETKEVTIVVGRDANRQHLDVSLAAVDAALRSLDRVEAQVPDIDALTVPKGRSPATLAASMWVPHDAVSLSDLFNLYRQLSKSQLTAMVTATAVAGYFFAPGHFSLLALSCTAVGTYLLSAAAGTVNQLLEIPFDSQMARTRDRVLVRAQLTSLHALSFAVASASVGAAMLLLGVNSLVAGLGVLNLFLYTCVYTPMKRFTIVNTWVGAINGAIPPMMGWAAATGCLDAGSFLIAFLLYSWQFPHFNALSWNMRADYSRAGYCMMSVINPGLCKRVALRHCLYLHAICLAAPLLDVTSWWFFCDTFLLNCAFTFYAWRFYRDGDAKSSRHLFRVSLLYLPVLLLFLVLSKKREEDGAKNRSSNRTEGFHWVSRIVGM